MISYCEDCGEYLGDYVDGRLYKFGQLITKEHLCPGLSYTLEKAKRYRVTNRITKQTYQASAFSADVACKKLGWLIGDCFVEEI